MNYCGAGSESPYSLMDQYYGDADVDHTDMDISANSSNLPFEFIDCTKSPMLSPSHVAMFYPQLGCDLHPLLMNQRKRSEAVSEKLNAQSLLANEDFQISNHHLVLSAPKPTRCKPKANKFIRKRNESIVEAAQQQVAEQNESVDADNSEKNRKIFFCRACGKSFKFQTSLLRHNNKVHNCKYQCPTCHRVFSRQAYLDVHISKPGSSCFVNCFTNKRTQKQPKTNQ